MEVGKTGGPGSAGTEVSRYSPRYMAEENSLNSDHTKSAADEYDPFWVEIPPQLGERRSVSLTG